MNIILKKIIKTFVPKPVIDRFRAKAIYAATKEYNTVISNEPKLKGKKFLNRLGTLEDDANAVYFLISEDAKYITGQNLCVDGGRTLGLYGDN